METKETKICPYCGEEILAVAKKCKHCGEWLTKEKIDATNTAQSQSEPKQEDNDQRTSVNNTEVKPKIINKLAIVLPVVAVLIIVLLISLLSSGNKVNIVGTWDGDLSDYISLEKGKSEGVFVFGNCGEPESGLIAFNFKSDGQMEIAMLLTFNKKSYEYMIDMRLDGTYSLKGNAISIQPRQLSKANDVDLYVSQTWLDFNGYTKEGLEMSIISELNRMNMNPILQLLSKKTLTVTKDEYSRIFTDSEGKQFKITQNNTIFNSIYGNERD